jgi:HEAT repeat protein
MYGTFGHGFSGLTPEGKLHGSVPPYGPVNMAGLPANLSIVTGKLCGVQDPEVDAAIERASKFFGYFVDKGAIPYGEHEPWPYHENNGKNSISALLFSLQKNKIKEAQFFAKMATAGYRSRECGHTGQGFSYLWSALGANVGGPAAAAAFIKEASWHLDLVRRCDGSFTYDGAEQYGPGRTDDNTYYGKSSYDGLSPAATYVLTYSLPLKKLCITGKDANPAGWLSQQEVAAAIASGSFDLDRKQKSPQELVVAFGDWSPIVRSWAAEEVSKRPEAKAMVPQLIALAGGKDVHISQGACETLGYLKSAEALPVLVAQLSNRDRWVRYKAAQAIRKMGGEAKPAVSDILKAVVKTAEPIQPIVWADAIQFTHGQLAAALFAGGLTDALKDADPKLLYPAIGVISRNPDGMARATLRGYFERNLTLEDVQALAPDLLAAVKTMCPADTMFSAEIRMGAFKALTKYHYKEGIEAGIGFAKTQGGHGSESRTGEIMKEIAGYGSAARDAVPELKELVVALNDQVKNGGFPGGELNDRRVGAVQAAIKTIEAAKDQPELRSIAR